MPNLSWIGVSVKTYESLKKLTHYIFELKMFILSNRFQVFKNQQDDTFKDSCGNISSSNILFKILIFHVLLLMDKFLKTWFSINYPK
jgi:hypothetical protein